MDADETASRMDSRLPVGGRLEIMGRNVRKCIREGREWVELLCIHEGNMTEGLPGEDREGCWLKGAGGGSSFLEFSV